MFSIERVREYAITQLFSDHRRPFCYSVNSALSTNFDNKSALEYHW